MIHSQKDYRLDVSQGFELYTALERRGVPARFLYFPDEGHWVLKPQNSQLWYETVDDWCDRWTKRGKYREVERSWEKVEWKSGWRSSGRRSGGRWARRG